MTTYGNSFSERAKKDIADAQAVATWRGHAILVHVADSDYWALRVVSRATGKFSYQWLYKNPQDWPANGREYRTVSANRAVNELAAIYETEAIRAVLK